MNVLLTKVKLKFVHLYLDDTVIFWRIPDKHFDYVLQVMTLLQDYRVTMNVKSANALQMSSITLVLVMSFVVGVLRLPRTVDAILKLEYSTTVAERRLFLGLSNVSRCFVLSFTRTAGPLNKMLCKCQPQTFDRLSENEPTALETKKTKLVEPSVRALPRFPGYYTIYMNACDKQIGWFLVTEGTWWNKQTNWRWVPFVKLRRSRILDDALRTPDRGMTRFTASLSQGGMSVYLLPSP